MISALQSPFMISVRGERGTGKTLVGAHICHWCLRVGLQVDVVLLSHGDSAVFLNQTLGIGLDLFSFECQGRLRVHELQPNLTYIAALVRECSPRPRALMVDGVERLLQAREIEPILGWLLKQNDISSVLVRSTDATQAAIHTADLSIQLTRSGHDVRSAAADSTMTVVDGSKRADRSFHVASQGLHLWKRA